MERTWLYVLPSGEPVIDTIDLRELDRLGALEFERIINGFYKLKDKG